MPTNPPLRPPLKHSTGPQQAAKAEQRARNKEAGLTTRSGSSGSALRVKNWPHVDWAEVEDDVEWVTDLAATISHTQVGAAGQMIATMNVPLAYAHAVLDAHLAGRGGALYVRVYQVPVEKFMERMEAEES